MLRLAAPGALALAFIVTASGLTREEAQPASPADRVAAQKEAMGPFAKLDGRWRGPAWIMSPSGERQTLVQTERVGPFLDGSVRMVEGRGYDENGTVTFNALGIFSYDAGSQTYTMRSYAQGRVGDFPVKVTEDGFKWEMPAGPGKLQYTATIKDGAWHEVGEHVMPGAEPMRFFEMTLERLGDTDWPGIGAMPME
ncbi:MAG: DUF1579 domain-containing protein [Phycisphaeraceae bacterium]|nr:MAG: DUF1579 domain-containing protein [Phycisphaeraceae bacterium]